MARKSTAVEFDFRGNTYTVMGPIDDQWFIYKHHEENRYMLDLQMVLSQREVQHIANEWPDDSEIKAACVVIMEQANEQ